ncbi:LamG domain-containing protein [Mangrovivirga sp. M17]|uniref:LamG domain-containing protein n=1 Tax=Mangrovivirga halotolerans TaxID=2993936 RepID=A0ABT3RLK0_9BACT|nr:LamG domain-containing protein [Mangrovivirga halotolerans]MCX2742679.1 LamG domain-containing protein [Mangrovivirga halotolerans]
MQFNLFSKGLLALVFISVFSFITSCSDEEGTEPKNEEPEDIDIPRDGLIAFYPMNGNMNDESGVGDSANGGFYGTPKPAELTADRYGNLNSAYKIETTNNLNALDAPKLAYNGDLSYCMWIKANTSGVILNDAMNKIEFDDIENKYVGIIDMNSNRIIVDDVVSDPEKWHLIVLTWDNNAAILKLYIDGVHVSESTAEASIFRDMSGNMVMGNSGFSGILDDIIVYHKALTSNEVMAIYNQTITK